MPPTEEAAFKSLKHPAQGPFCGECGTPAASQWRGTVPPDEERIRRDARDAALEEAAKQLEASVGDSVTTAAVVTRSCAAVLRAMKVTP